MARGKAKPSKDYENPHLALSSPSFISLLITQWLTAINDNVFRWLVIGVGKDFVPPGDIGWVLMMGTVCFVAPYLVLAAPAGWLADRFRKRDVIVACKILEIVVMTLGVLAIMISNFHLLLVVVALMGTQSALFSPAKMGTIPELLGQEKISAANGLFGLTTVTATIIGMGIGGWLADFTAPKGAENLWVSALVLIGLAVVGTAVSVVIRPIPAANPTKKFPILIFPDTFRDLVILWSYRALFVVALGKVYFWGIGALTQLNIDAFAAESGGLAEMERFPLLLAVTVGVACGSILAGIMSGGRIELGMLWIGVVGIFVSATLVFTVPNGFMDHGIELNTGYTMACIFLAMLGLSSGLFDVPLSAYLQHKSPREKRGSILAANNFLLFSGILLAAVAFFGLRAPGSPGSMEHVANYVELPESVEQRRKITDLRDEFLASWVDVPSSSSSSSESSLPALLLLKQDMEESERKELIFNGGREDLPDLRQYWRRGNAEIQEPLLAELMWIDMQQRRERNVDVVKNLYYERYALPETDQVTAAEKKARLQLIKNVFEQSGNLPLLTARQIFLLIGFTAIPVFAFLMYRIPHASLRFVAWPLARMIFRIKVTGRENIPEDSGALLVGNSCSTLDKLLLTLSTERRVRWVSNDASVKSETLAGKFWGEINIGGGAARQQQAFADARKALKRGEILLVFPEQQISDTAQLQNFEENYFKLIRFTPVPIVPVYIDEFWGSRWTANRGKGFWNLADGLRKPVSFHISAPLQRIESIQEIRHAVQELGAGSVSNRVSKFISPPQMFVRRCKQRKFALKAGDLTGAEMTGGVLLMRTLILRRLLKRHVLTDPNERMVGVLIPPSVGGVVVNAALALDNRVAVNLNYTASPEILNACIRQAGIKKILTTEKVMSKLDLELDAEFVMLDELRKNVTTGDKVHGVLNAYAKPAGMVESMLGLNKIQPDDLLTIIFTSGSTGVPKGVMLTHQNVATNVEAIQDVVHLTAKDVIVGILPFFHSFGYTVTLWGSMGLQTGGIYHFTPLDGRQVGRLVRKFKGTCMLATPTFLRTYLRRTDAKDFESLEIVVAGAEKLPSQLCDAFEAKFGIRPVEGYGATETSPLASVNVPPRGSRTATVENGCKEGSVGRPIPNVVCKAVDLETGKDLGVNETGMLYIKGPNVMKGYLDNEQLTAEVVIDGWYKTGDIGYVDQDGFIIITGRQSRFSKIGGEMVPHIQIEEKLTQLIGADEEAGLKAVVTSVPDEKKGERLIVLHTEIDKTPAELIAGLKESDLPNLYIPSQDSFVQIDEIPVLGTGKLDLHGIKKIAMDRFIGDSNG